MRSNARALACLAFALTLPLCLASAFVPEPQGYWTGPINSAVPATLTGATVIHARELQQLLERDLDLVVVDVSNSSKRPPELPRESPWLPLPHAAIPRSIWIPDVGLGVLPAQLDRFFRDRLRRATRGDLDHPIVFYCHERCWLSWNAAKRALAYGYRRVHWFPEGIEGWQAAGFATAVIEPEAPRG